MFCSFAYILCLALQLLVAVITDLMLWNLKIWSYLVKIPSALAHFMNCSAFSLVAISWHVSALAPAHSLKMISSATPSTVIAIGWTSAWTVYLQLLFISFLLTFVLSVALFCSVLVQLNTFLLVTALVCMWLAPSLFQSSYHHHLCHFEVFFEPSFSWRLHSFAFILRWPIHW